MTPEEGYDLAKFQRPGRMIIMGPESAYDVQMPSADDQPIWVKNTLGIKDPSAYPPHHWSFWAYDMFHELGWVPSLWARGVADNMARLTGIPTDADRYRWLRKPSTGLREVAEWIRERIPK